MRTVDLLEVASTHVLFINNGLYGLRTGAEYLPRGAEIIASYAVTDDHVTASWARPSDRSLASRCPGVDLSSTELADLWERDRYVIGEVAHALAADTDPTDIFLASPRPAAYQH